MNNCDYGIHGPHMFCVMCVSFKVLVHESKERATSNEN